jgi:hypothetical protein
VMHPLRIERLESLAAKLQPTQYAEVGKGPSTQSN